jgi:hypothetical protein
MSLQSNRCSYLSIYPTINAIMDFNMFNLTAGNYQILYRTNYEAHVEPLDDKKKRE